MPTEHIKALKQSRESFVRKRRAMVEQKIPAGAAVQHFAPAFVDLQNAIEAMDRAIADEDKLPVGYPLAEAEEPQANGGSEMFGSNIVDVDCDPA